MGKNLAIQKKYCASFLVLCHFEVTPILSYHEYVTRNITNKNNLDSWTCHLIEPYNLYLTDAMEAYEEQNKLKYYYSRTSR